jgi:hypothetical protein
MADTKGATQAVEPKDDSAVDRIEYSDPEKNVRFIEKAEDGLASSEDEEVVRKKPVESARDLVTSIIRAEDDPTLNPWTFRTWFLGMVDPLPGPTIQLIVGRTWTGCFQCYNDSYCDIQATASVSTPSISCRLKLCLGRANGQNYSLEGSYWEIPQPSSSKLLARADHFTMCTSLSKSTSELTRCSSTKRNMQL